MTGDYSDDDSSDDSDDDEQRPAAHVAPTRRRWSRIDRANPARSRPLPTYNPDIESEAAFNRERLGYSSADAYSRSPSPPLPWPAGAANGRHPSRVSRAEALQSLLHRLPTRVLSIAAIERAGRVVTAACGGGDGGGGDGACCNDGAGDGAGAGDGCDSDAAAAVGNSSSTTCSVCLDAYAAGDVVRTLPCLHMFHTRCVDAWLVAAACPTCPLCKTNCMTAVQQDPYRDVEPRRMVYSAVVPLSHPDARVRVLGEPARYLSQQCSV